MKVLKNMKMGIKYPFLYDTIDLNEKIKSARNKAFDVKIENGLQKTYIVNLKQFVKLYCLLIFNWIQNHLPRFTTPKSYNIFEGWDKAFGKQMLDDLKKAAKKDNCLYIFKITGFDVRNGLMKINWVHAGNETYNTIIKYQNLSWSYCYKCGKKTEWIDLLDKLTVCNDCKNHNCMTIEQWTNEFVS